MIALVVAGLFALWHFTPLVDVVRPERVFDWALTFGQQWWAPLAVIAAYTPACFTMFPRPLITLFAVIAFGPWFGFAYAMSGILLAALVTYAVGVALPTDTLCRLAGPRMESLAGVLRRRGLIACVAIRIVPVAPFLNSNNAAVVSPDSSVTPDARPSAASIRATRAAIRSNGPRRSVADQLVAGRRHRPLVCPDGPVPAAVARKAAPCGTRTREWFGEIMVGG